MHFYIFLSLFNEEYRRTSNDSWIKNEKLASHVVCMQ